MPRCVKIWLLISFMAPDCCQQGNDSLFLWFQESDGASYCAIQVCADGCSLGLQWLLWWNGVCDYGRPCKVAVSPLGGWPARDIVCFGRARGLSCWGGAHQLLQPQHLSCCAFSLKIISHADRPLWFKPGHICCESRDLQNPEQKEMQNALFISRLSADTSV